MSFSIDVSIFVKSRVLIRDCIGSRDDFVVVVFNKSIYFIYLFLAALGLPVHRLPLVARSGGCSSL